MNNVKDCRCLAGKIKGHKFFYLEIGQRYANIYTLEAL